MTLWHHQEQLIQLVIYMFIDNGFLLLLQWNPQHIFITFASRCDRLLNDTNTFIYEIGNTASYDCWIFSKAYAMILHISLEYNISIFIETKFWFLIFYFLNIFIIKSFNLNVFWSINISIFCLETFTCCFVVEIS